MYTSKVLDILDLSGVKATFFVVGRNAALNPHLMRRAVESGHEIGNHTWSHTALTALKKKGQRRHEVEGASDVVRAATGHKPLLFRPPYGAMRPGTNREVRELGMLPVVWSVDVRDYDPKVTVKALVARVRKALRPGSIILLHDGGGDRAKTVAALPSILAEVAKAGYRAVTITQLLNDAPPSRTTSPAGCSGLRRRDDGRQCLHHRRIEARAGAGPEQLERARRIERLLVGAPGRDRRPGVGSGDDPRLDRDRIAPSPSG